MPTSDASGSTLDSHLILNGLGRVSARYYAIARQECAEIFAVSDYVGLGLRLLGQRVCSCAQEAQLLESYLALQSACKYQQLEVHITQPDDPGAGRLPVHMVCDMARCLIEWQRPEAGQAWSLHAQLESATVDMQLCCDSPGPLPAAALQTAIAQLSHRMEEAAGWKIAVCTQPGQGAAQAAIRAQSAGFTDTPIQP
jgi:hypothetical protein